MLTNDASVYSIDLTATNDISPALQAAGDSTSVLIGQFGTLETEATASLDALATQAEDAGARIRAALSGIATPVANGAGFADLGAQADAAATQIESAFGRIDTAIKGVSLDATAGDPFAGLIAQADAAASSIAATMRGLELDINTSIDSIGGMVTGLQDPMHALAGMLTRVGDQASYAADQLDRVGRGNTGFATLSGQADATTATISADTDAIVAAIDRAAVAVDTSLGGIDGSLKALGGTMDGLVGSVDDLSANFTREANAAKAAADANYRLADSQKAVRDSSIGAGGSHGGFLGGVGNAGHGLMKAGGAVDLLGLGSLWEYGKFQNAFQAAGHNAMLSQPDITAITNAGNRLFANNPVPYTEIATAYQRAAEQFQQHKSESPTAYANRLSQIVKESLRSAVGTNGNTADIAQVLSKVLFDYGLGQNQSQHAMDVVHAIGGLGGNMTVQDLSQYFGRPAAIGSELGFSLPQLGGMFDVLSKQFGPRQTGTYLMGMEQHMLAQTKGAETMLGNIGMVGEFNQQGAAKYGPYKLLTDLQQHAQAYSHKTGISMGTIMQAIMPSTRGGLAWDALMTHGHLGMAESLTRQLGGSVMTHDANPLGSGSHKGIYGITASQYASQMKTVEAQAKTMENSLKSLAVTIGGTVAPVFGALARALTPLLHSFQQWVSAHPQIVQSFSAVAIAATAIGAALVAVSAIGAGTILAAIAGGFVAVGVASKGLSGIGNAIKDFIAGFTGADPAAQAAGRLGDRIQTLEGYTSPMQQFGAAVHSVFDSLAPKIQGVASFFQQVATAIGPLIQSDMPLFHTLLSQVGNDLGLLGTDIGNTLKQLGLFQGGAKDSTSGAKGLADILNGALTVAFGAVITIIDAVIIVIDAAVVVIRGIITVVQDFAHVIQGVPGVLSSVGSAIGTFFSNFGSQARSTLTSVTSAIGAFFSNFGTTAKTGLDAVTTSVGSFFSGLGSALHAFVTSWLSAVTSWGSDFLTAVGSALKGITDAIATFFGTEVPKWTTAGKDWIGALVGGIKNDAGHIKDALVSAVQNALTAAKNAVGNAAGGLFSAIGTTAHTLVSGGAGGGAFGLSGITGTVMQQENEGNLVGTSGNVNDRDYLLGNGVQKPVYFPGGANAHYQVLPSSPGGGLGSNGGVSGIEEVAGPNGRFALVHLSQSVAPGQYHGGQYAGTTGWPTNPAYGNGVAGPSNAQLCVVYNGNGDPVALIPASSVKGRGGGAAGWPGARIVGPGGAAGAISHESLLPNASALTMHLASLTQSGQVPVPSFGAAQHSMAQINSTVIPQLYQQIQALPADLQTKFLPGLEGIAATWNKDQQAYLQGVAKENSSYAAKIQTIRSGATQAEDKILTTAGIRQTAATQTELARANAAHAAYEQARNAAIAKENTDRVAAGAHEDTSRSAYLSRKATLEKELQDASTSKRKATIQTEISSLDASHARAEAAANGTLTRKEQADRAHVAALDATYNRNVAKTDTILGIHNKEQAALLNQSIAARKVSEADALAKAKAAHEANLAKLKSVLEGHVGSLDAVLNKFEAGLAKGTTPDKIWESIVTATKDNTKAITESMALTLLQGKPITSFHAGTALTPEQIRQNRLAEQNGGGPINTVTPGTTTTSTVMDQLAAYGQQLAANDIAQAQLTDTLAAATAYGDLFSGNLSDLNKQLGQVSSDLTNQFIAGLIQGKGANDQLLSTIVQVDQAQNTTKEVTDGMNAAIQVAEGSVSGMTSSAKTLSDTFSGQWLDAMAKSGSAQNLYTQDMIKGAAAVAAFAAAANNANIIQGELTGNAKQLEQGLSGVLSASTDKISYFTDTIGRAGDGLAQASPDIATLASNAITAADNLGSLGDIIKGLTGVSDQAKSAAETSYARTGSITPAELSAYQQAHGAVTSATWDQVGADLQLYKSTGDLQGYYKSLGSEITLQQQKVMTLTAQYGANSTQVQQATATLQGMQTEYTGLGDAIKAMTTGAQLNATQFANANIALGEWTSSTDPATQAAKDSFVAISATNTAQNDYNTAVSKGTTDLGQLSTEAMAAANSLSGLVTAIANAVVSINNAASAATSTSATTTPSGNAAPAGFNGRTAFGSGANPYTYGSIHGYDAGGSGGSYTSGAASAPSGTPSGWSNGSYWIGLNSYSPGQVVNGKTIGAPGSDPSSWATTVSGGTINGATASSSFLQNGGAVYGPGPLSGGSSTNPVPVNITQSSGVPLTQPVGANTGLPVSLLNSGDGTGSSPMGTPVSPPSLPGGGGSGGSDSGGGASIPSSGYGLTSAPTSTSGSTSIPVDTSGTLAGAYGITEAPIKGKKIKVPKIPTVKIPKVKLPGSSKSSKLHAPRAKRLASPQRAWDEGYNAYITGAAPLECPYIAGSTNAAAWISGWETAQSDYRQDPSTMVGITMSGTVDGIPFGSTASGSSSASSSSYGTTGPSTGSGLYPGVGANVSTVNGVQIIHGMPGIADGSSIVDGVIRPPGAPAYNPNDPVTQAQGPQWYSDGEGGMAMNYVQTPMPPNLPAGSYQDHNGIWWSPMQSGLNKGSFAPSGSLGYTYQTGGGHWETISNGGATVGSTLHNLMGGGTPSTSRIWVPNTAPVPVPAVSTAKPYGGRSGVYTQTLSNGKQQAFVNMNGVGIPIDANGNPMIDAATLASQGASSAGQYLNNMLTGAAINVAAGMQQLAAQNTQQIINANGGSPNLPNGWTVTGPGTFQMQNPDGTITQENWDLTPGGVGQNVYGGAPYYVNRATGAPIWEFGGGQVPPSVAQIDSYGVMSAAEMAQMQDYITGTSGGLAPQYGVTTGPMPATSGIGPMYGVTTGPIAATNSTLNQINQKLGTIITNTGNTAVNTNNTALSMSDYARLVLSSLKQLWALEQVSQNRQVGGYTDFEGMLNGAGLSGLANLAGSGM